MTPFQANGSEPSGGAAFFLGQKIDGSTRADCRSCVDLNAVIGHPQLLLGSTKSDDQKVWPRGRDTGQNLEVFFLVVFKTYRRAVGPHDLYGWPVRVYPFSRSIGNSRSGSQQENGQAA
jgi:hypothetical protein